MRLYYRFVDPGLEGHQGSVGTGAYQRRRLRVQRVDRDVHHGVLAPVGIPPQGMQGLQTGIQRPQGIQLRIVVGHGLGLHRRLPTRHALSTVETPISIRPSGEGSDPRACPYSGSGGRGLPADAGLAIERVLLALGERHPDAVTGTRPAGFMGLRELAP